jgi:hypothetical protein
MLALNHDPPDLPAASHIVGITDVSHHACLALKMFAFYFFSFTFIYNFLSIAALCFIHYFTRDFF